MVKQKELKVKGLVKTPEGEWRVSVSGNRGVVEVITAVIAQALLESADYKVKPVGKGEIYNISSCDVSLLPDNVVSQATQAAEKPVRYFYPQQAQGHNPITGHFIGGGRGVA